MRVIHRNKRWHFLSTIYYFYLQDSQFAAVDLTKLLPSWFIYVDFHVIRFTEIILIPLWNIRRNKFFFYFYWKILLGMQKTIVKSIKKIIVSENVPKTSNDVCAFAKWRFCFSFFASCLANNCCSMLCVGKFLLLLLSIKSHANKLENEIFSL